MSDKIVDRVRSLVEAHHGKVTGVYIEFEARPDLATSLLPQLQRERDCIPVLLGHEMRLGPPMRMVGDKWVELPPPPIPGAKLDFERYPVHVYRIALPRKSDAENT